MNKFQPFQWLGIVLAATNLFLLIFTAMIEVSIPLNQQELILATKAINYGIISFALSIGIIILGMVLNDIYE